MLKTTPSKAILKGIIGASLASLLAVPAHAVNIPEGGAVTPDSVFIINFQVREGCDGAPMDTLEVTVPASVRNPTPEAVSGWDVAVETSPPDEGDEAGDTPTIVRWTGGPLEDGAFKEFGLWARFPDEPGAKLEFPVVQRCGLVERIFSGTDGDTPAPTVTLTERFFQGDLEELSASLDGVIARADELGSQLADVDAANLRSRVSDTEAALEEMAGQLDELVQRIEALEQAGQQ